MSENKARNGVSPERSASLFRRYFPVPFLALTAAYCAFIYYLSSIPSFPVPPPFIFFDKVVHFGLYGLLGAVVASGLHRAGHGYSAIMRVAIPTAFCFLYGLSDETHQLFVSNRTFDLGDLAADSFGAATAAILLLYVRRWMISKGENKGGAK